MEWLKALNKAVAGIRFSFEKSPLKMSAGTVERRGTRLEAVRQVRRLWK